MKKAILILTTLLLVFFNLSAQEKDVNDILYEAIYAEEISGELDKAEKLYQQVLVDFKDDRQACAKARYHLGLIAEKSKSRRVEESKSQYNKLISDYPDIGEYARMARNRLQVIEDQNTFIDPRDGHKYKWVKIGDQIWMAENLAYMPWVNPPKKQEFGIWVYDYDGHDVAEAKATENYQKFGCLYDWTTAMDIDPKYLEEEWLGDYENHPGICPPGWRIPSDEDWDKLEMLLGLTKAQINERDDPENWYLGYYETSGADKLKSTFGWLSGGNGSNEFRFNFIPGGSRYAETPDYPDRKALQDVGSKGVVWTSTEYTDSLCDECFEKGEVSFSRFLQNVTNSQRDNNIYRSPDVKSSGFSVRCIKSDNHRVSNKEKSYSEENQIRYRQKKVIDPSYINVQPEFIYSIPKTNSYKGSIVELDGNIVTWNPSDSTLASYNADDYRLIWSKKDLVYRRGLDGHESIITQKDTIIYFNGAEIVYLNPKNGNKYRSFSVNEISALYPIVYKNILIVSKGKYGTELVGINNLDGSAVWNYVLDDSVSINDPHYNDDIIYFGLFSRKRIEVKNGKHINLLAINPEDGEILWTFESAYTSNGFQSPRAYKDQLLFKNNRENYLYSLNKKTGKLNWRYYVGENSISEITIKNDRIYLPIGASWNKTRIVSCIDLNGHEIWKKSVPGSNWQWEVYDKIDDNYIPKMTGSSSSGIHLALINVNEAGPDWLIDLGDGFAGEPSIINDKIFVPKKDSILVYKYPDFKE